MKFLKPFFIAASLALAVPAATHADGLSDSQQDKADKALLDAVQAEDVTAAEAALKAGARVDSEKSVTDHLKFSALSMAVDSATVAYKKNQSAMVKLLLDHGAVPTTDTLKSALFKLPIINSSDDEARQYYSELIKTVDLLFATAKKTFTKDDYTKLLFDTNSVGCKPDIIERLLNEGADPNDTNFLVSVEKRGDMTYTWAGFLPLDKCLQDYLLNPDNQELRGELAQGVNILLAHHADPSLLLDNPEKLYERDPDSKTADPSVLQQGYKVTDEEKALLKGIVKEGQFKITP